MPGWYDIKSFGDLTNREEDEEGILKSRDYFHSLIDAEVAKGIPPSRIVVGGFSQGGAISLINGVTYPKQLGGIFGLSCYLLLQRKLKDLIPTDSPNQNTPIFMGHGDADPVVQYKYGKMSADELVKLGYKVDFRTYECVYSDVWCYMTLMSMQGPSSLRRPCRDRSSRVLSESADPTPRR
jgi:predicted esterase